MVNVALCFRHGPDELPRPVDGVLRRWLSGVLSRDCRIPPTGRCGEVRLGGCACMRRIGARRRVEQAGRVGPFSCSTCRRTDGERHAGFCAALARTAADGVDRSIGFERSDARDPGGRLQPGASRAPSLAKCPRPASWSQVDPMKLDPSEIRVAIVGAGLAGASCAAGLRSAGVDVTVFGKSRNVGGRMATWRACWSDGSGVEYQVSFDHRAQSLTAVRPRFRATMNRIPATSSPTTWRRLSSESTSRLNWRPHSPDDASTIGRNAIKRFETLFPNP